MDDKKQPIVVKKIRTHRRGYHGGAWKVAYADFATAMMAFFLLMWALTGTTQHVREGIADWFRNPTGAAGPGGGAMEVPRSDQRDKDAQALSEAERQADKQRLDALLRKLRKAIERSEALNPFRDQLLLDITPEGLRIQIVDKKNRPMFDLGSAMLKPYTSEILEEIAKSISTVPNKISITGHTDATPFASSYIFVAYGSMEERRAYSNWELSADRANAARRALIQGGLKEEKIGRVVGLASSVLFDEKNPFNPVNRRINIIVLNRAAEQAIESVNEQQTVRARDAGSRLSGRE